LDAGAVLRRAAGFPAAAFVAAALRFVVDVGFDGVFAIMPSPLVLRITCANRAGVNIVQTRFVRHVVGNCG